MDMFLTLTTELQEDVEIARDVDSLAMPLGLTSSFPVEQTILDKYEKFISGMYLGEITRNTLIVLIDAAPQPILFDTKAPEQALWAQQGGACPHRDESGDAAAALVEDPEKLVLATIQRQKRQEIVQEHFGYESGKVSLRNAALVVRRSAANYMRLASIGDCLYQHCPGFEECMRRLLWILLGEEVEKRVEMGLAKDSSNVVMSAAKLGAL
ncbi:hypothetical protein EDB87DRAFT_1578476 [Lactarius vividus]|nr:hypothetical protein EDB87DRAFT_1578476 [Lactarius vividus]